MYYTYKIKLAVIFLFSLQIKIRFLKLYQNRKIWASSNVMTLYLYISQPTLKLKSFDISSLLTKPAYSSWLPYQGDDKAVAASNMQVSASNKTHRTIEHFRASRYSYRHFWTTQNLSTDGFWSCRVVKFSVVRCCFSSRKNRRDTQQKLGWCVWARKLDNQVRPEIEKQGSATS